MTIYSFAYGSNMCCGWLRGRGLSSARYTDVAQLLGYGFRFHKQSQDKSGKGNALWTGRDVDVVWGAVVEIDKSQKPLLDEAEGLGRGYYEDEVEVVTVGGTRRHALIYLADKKYIDDSLRPYSWYKRLVTVGGLARSLPNEYIRAVDAAESWVDTDPGRIQKAEVALRAP